MNNTLSLPMSSEATIARPLAPIVPLSTLIKPMPAGPQEKRLPKPSRVPSRTRPKQVATTPAPCTDLPQFYTEPIFKPKKHDML